MHKIFPSPCPSQRCHSQSVEITSMSFNNDRRVITSSHPFPSMDSGDMSKTTEISWDPTFSMIVATLRFAPLPARIKQSTVWCPSIPHRKQNTLIFSYKNSSHEALLAQSNKTHGTAAWKHQFQCKHGRRCPSAMPLCKGQQLFVYPQFPQSSKI